MSWIEDRVAELPEGVRRRLAEGPWPEPHCGVCRAMDNSEEREGVLGDELTLERALVILDWHDEPLQHGPRWKMGEQVYERCMVIYAAAKRSLEPESQVA